MKRTARALVVSGAVAAATFAIPVAAHAAVTNCNFSSPGANVERVHCTTTNGSQYRIAIKCEKIDNPALFHWDYGHWVPPGNYSEGGCTSDSFIGQMRVDKR